MLIGISGKIKSGKDEIAKYIIEKYPNMIIEKFGGALKDILCIIIGCTREQLEDQEFKETELGEEWWYFKLEKHNGAGRIDTELKDYLSYKEYLEPEMEQMCDNAEINIELIKLSPRIMLQLIGTEAGRGIIHPKIWINALFSRYKPLRAPYDSIAELLEDKHHGLINYPDWIITDVRFPDEANEVKRNGGIMIRINRLLQYRFPKEWEKFCSELLDESFIDWIKQNNKELYKVIIHESETALDDYFDFDFEIHNNKSLDKLKNNILKIV